LHVIAWQQQVAALVGLEALARVPGFSPSEMALPDHPDVALRVRADVEGLRVPLGCSFKCTPWSSPTGGGVRHLHLPNRLVCTSSRGESASEHAKRDGASWDAHSAPPRVRPTTFIAHPPRYGTAP
jgi:hypothetical protein